MKSHGPFQAVEAPIFHRETDYLLKSPRNAERLLQAIAELNSEMPQAAVPPTVI